MFLLNMMFAVVIIYRVIKKGKKHPAVRRQHIHNQVNIKCYMTFIFLAAVLNGGCPLCLSIVCCEIVIAV